MAGRPHLTVLETERLRLRRLTVGDAPFMVTLLNDPAFIQFVGDRGVRTREDAETYLLEGPLASYAALGFGLYGASLLEADELIGICGLLKRPALDDVDLGFAFLPPFRGRGYASEAAAAVLAYARNALGLRRVVAFTAPDHAASIHVLGKLGFAFERNVRLSDDGNELQLFATSPSAGSP